MSEELEMLNKVKNGEIDFSILLQQYNGLIYKIINKCNISGLDRDDLYSILSAKLYFALCQYDESSGCKFITFATNLLKQEIAREIEKSNRVKSGDAIYETFVRLNKPIDDGDIKLTEIHELYLHGDYTQDELDKNYFFSIINEVLSKEEECNQAIAKMCVYQGMSDTEIAKELGISQQNIWRRRKLVFKKLKAELYSRGYNSDSNLDVRLDKKCKPVICVNTNQRFETISEACEFFGFSPNSKIGDACNGKRLSCGKHPMTKEKLTWKWAE